MLCGKTRVWNYLVSWTSAIQPILLLVTQFDIKKYIHSDKTSLRNVIQTVITSLFLLTVFEL